MPGADQLVMSRHASVQVEQLFKPLCIIAKAATDVDALQNFIISFVRLT